MIEGTINSLNHLGRKKLGEKQRKRKLEQNYP
jgi:hypothetical protein